MDTAKYAAKIEELRNRLLEIVGLQGDFMHTDVLRLSEELDYYIVQYQKCINKKERQAIVAAH